MINLISWSYFNFIRTIKIAIGLVINKMINLAISQAILIVKKIANDFFKLFL